LHQQAESARGSRHIGLGITRLAGALVMLPGGRLNIAHKVVDRHVIAGRLNLDLIFLNSPTADSGQIDT
jgi:hypothetical protein